MQKVRQCEDTDTQGEWCAKAEAEFRERQLQAKEHQRFPATTRS